MNLYRGSDAILLFAPPMVISRSGTPAVVTVAVRPGVEIDPEKTRILLQDADCGVAIIGETLFFGFWGNIITAEEHEQIAEAIGRALYFKLGIRRVRQMEFDSIGDVERFCKHLAAA